MESLDKENKPLTGGEQKIEEYANRIKNGESKDSIFQDLPESFKSGIEDKLANLAEEKTEQGISEIPPQYQGLNSETLDFIWTFPEYIGQEKTKELKEKKARVLAALREKESSEITKTERHQADQKEIEELREQLGIVKPVEGTEIREGEATAPKPEEPPTLSVEERKKIHGWTASYELAKIAKQQGVDLSKISREDYANFAIQNSLAIDDDQLRVAPWQRMGTSVEEIVLTNRERKSEIKEDSEKAFAKFCYEIRQKAGQEDRFLSENIRVRQGTKDSNSWLFFGINNGTGGKSNETYKSYVSVKDLNTLTPERFTQFMTALRDANYNGDIKIFQDLSEQGVRLNDQIVMHGGSQADAELALHVAENFFGADIDQKSVGKDEVIDGEPKSYSQILAQKIAEAVNPSKG
ncbi:MAG: hypothetical protein A2481_00365 [Candidatus Yonathbacteria bacterium RIFOXYC2_FULL_47_9]|nr:MAG: hypothetical protein A2481_00365 [Candidatus Yonathbacteria bacterium RIFOXYC2_FULL_47_9]HAT68513.1 hypothetical protein [Candidatus Yonathbacteria bacterium]